MSVPMIAWPLQADQMMNRTSFVDVLNVAVGVCKGWRIWGGREGAGGGSCQALNSKMREALPCETM